MKVEQLSNSVESDRTYKILEAAGVMKFEFSVGGAMVGAFESPLPCIVKS